MGTFLFYTFKRCTWLPPAFPLPPFQPKNTGQDLLTSFLRDYKEATGVNLGTMPITENPGQAWPWRWRPFMTSPKWDVTKSQDFSLWEWKSINLLTKESEQKDITFSNLIYFQSSIPASAFYLGEMASWPGWEGHLLGSIWRMGR